MAGKELLIQWRKKMGYTKREAAKRMGVCYRMYRYYEDGDKGPSKLRAQDIARRTRGAVPSDSWQ